MLKLSILLLISRLTVLLASLSHVFIVGSNAGYTMFQRTVQGCWLPTPFTSFLFTSPTVCHRVPSGFERAIPQNTVYPALLPLLPRMCTPRLPVVDNWPTRQFKWTRPFRWKTKSGFCACAITFQTCSTEDWDLRCHDCRLVCSYRRLVSHHLTLKMKALRFIEKSLTSYRLTWCGIPEYVSLQYK